MKNCDDIRERLSLYLDNELQDDERAAIEAHVNSCASCASFVEKELAFLNAIRGSGPLHVASPELKEKVGEIVNGPRPVGEQSRNPFGIFDLGENVHEWCSDWFCKDYYADSPERNPAGPATGDRRASRGGSWRHHVKATRCAARSSIPPAFQYADYGFRVVCSRVE